MKTPSIMLSEFKLHWKNYVYQSALAALAIFIITIILRMQNAVIIASLGSSAFIIFALPNAASAKSRNVIGGHVVGIVAGSLFSIIPQTVVFITALIYALAVGLSILIMVVTDTEHPPAAGTALGIAMSGSSSKIIVAVIASAIVLALVRHFFRRYIRDLQ
jgi:CBS-domain-containing membrane protein